MEMNVKIIAYLKNGIKVFDEVYFSYIREVFNPSISCSYLSKCYIVAFFCINLISIYIFSIFY